ncbi:NfeD family protein [Halorhodospira halochloris]|uniref:NfeD family protein n=1 Tax=Halorhodospira halochloris TaxID=1052 RepID=UPI001EE79E38|nr:NfeD family protein [Halorhodospira halochloris]
MLLAMAGMALFGMGAALLGLSWEFQILSAALSGVLLIPLALKALKKLTPGELSQSLDDPRLRGQQFKVYTDSGGQARVTVFGDEFMARPSSIDQSLKDGSLVRIVRFEGNTAIVTPND